MRAMATSDHSHMGVIPSYFSFADFGHILPWLNPLLLR